MLVRIFRWVVVLIVTTLQLASCTGTSNEPAVRPPNILFVIMDDVGIDQMPAFGYGGGTPPNMPTIDAVAHSCASGDVFFVAAGQDHRFTDFSHDFATWVVFWGPQGGEHS